MPGATIGIEARIGDLSQRQVHRTALRRRRRSVDARSHERVPERHLLSDGEQPIFLGRGRRRRRDSESLGRTPDQQSVAGRLCRPDQQELLGLLGQRLETPKEALLYAPGQPGGAEESEAPRQLRRVQSSREFEQRQRVASRLGHDQITHAFVEREPDSRAQKRACLAVP